MAAQSTVSMNAAAQGAPQGHSVPCSGVCSCAALQERETERLQRIENLSQSIKRKEEFVNKLVRM